MNNSVFKKGITVILCVFLSACVFESSDSDIVNDKDTYQINGYLSIEKRKQCSATSTL